VYCRFETSDWGHQRATLDLQKPSLDLRLYAVTDPACNARCHRSNAEAVRQAVEGGVTLVQLREKSADGAAFVHEARQLVDVTRPAGVCFKPSLDSHDDVLAFKPSLVHCTVQQCSAVVVIKRSSC